MTPPLDEASRLDESCWECGGLGVLRVGGKRAPMTCSACGGRGRRLTEAGTELLEFLRFWADPTKDETYGRLFEALTTRIAALEGER